MACCRTFADAVLFINQLTPSHGERMYIGPEVMMPLASILAAITGVLLMFWRRAISIARSTATVVARTFSRLLPR
jgi:hypothetical protein